MMELFIVIEDLHLSFGGFATNPMSVVMSLLECSLTFVMASPVQNENVWIENANDLMDESSFT